MLNFSIINAFNINVNQRLGRNNIKDVKKIFLSLKTEIESDIMYSNDFESIYALRFQLYF
jgi:hypothetical protein